MMTYGYNPQWSEGALKCPIFQTSTFVFKSAQEGKSFFSKAYGIDENEHDGLIYSRLNNPDLQILEERLALWDKAEACAVFESGMSAISSVFLEFLKPGDLLVHSAPLYGGTDHFIKKILTRFGIHVACFHPSATRLEIESIIKQSEGKFKMIYLESPANPTNQLIDIEMCSQIAKSFDPDSTVVVDNTYMGPLWCHPIQHGADLIVYSATKFIGGHSDVIAGACLGSQALIQRLKGFRTFVGNMAGPWTGWLLMRSLETMKMRMETQAYNAEKIAKLLTEHPAVEGVQYLGMLSEDDPMYPIYKKQYTSPGSMIAFQVVGGEQEAFAVLDNMKLIKLAVSLGSTESLAQHPDTMTHADVDPMEKEKLGITSNMIRLSVGVEHHEDIWNDLKQALNVLVATPVV
ncbi:MAG: aminotransferase class I/II-fold pyridoxal phosphate-dependent enzyme [Cyclobacteriaceae bacterium]